MLGSSWVSWITQVEATAVWNHQTDCNKRPVEAWCKWTLSGSLDSASIRLSCVVSWGCHCGTAAVEEQDVSASKLNCHELSWISAHEGSNLGELAPSFAIIHTMCQLHPKTSHSPRSEKSVPLDGGLAGANIRVHSSKLTTGQPPVAKHGGYNLGQVTKRDRERERYIYI